MKLGISPIIWSNDDLPELGGDISFSRCLDEMALSGYDGCEIGSKFPKDIDVLRSNLKQRELVVCNQWFSFKLTTESLESNLIRLEKHTKYLYRLGCKVVGGGETGNSCHTDIPLSVFDERPTLKSEEEWNSYCYKLEMCGQLVAKYNMSLSFHHHMGTIVQTLAETQKLLNKTNPKYVSLNYDCGHFYFAGEDPVNALRLLIDRTSHLHLKDVRKLVLMEVIEDKLSFLEAVKRGVFTVPGDPEGTINFTEIFNILKSNNYSEWIVIEAEQDPDKANPLKYARMAREFIKSELNI